MKNLTVGIILGVLTVLSIGSAKAKYDEYKRFYRVYDQDGVEIWWDEVEKVNCYFKYYGQGASFSCVRSMNY